MILTNNAQSANVFWIVEGAVSMGAGTHMEGTILGGAAISLGAATTINGRLMAGSAAGAIALAATTISAVTGTPPTGSPPPIVVADTVTDANGNYLFGSVQPGTNIVRWDLSNVTTNFRITAANQGGDDGLDSDGVSGDVGGFVYSTEIEVLGGTTNLSVDLGLVATLLSVKAAAMDDLTTALAAYLDANCYTANNWTALKTARTNGDIGINAATDTAGVATAKASALAAMEAVSTAPGVPGDANGDGLISASELCAAYSSYWQDNPTVITNAFGLHTATVQLAVTNMIGWDLTVQASTNLLTGWTTLPARACPVFQFADPVATNCTSRFYRLSAP